jgi:hypothetical protein
MRLNLGNARLFGFVDGKSIDLGSVQEIELTMQLYLAGTVNQGSDLVIQVSEGNAGWHIPVVRAASGDYQCMDRRCIYKKQANFCEHVLFARQAYDNVISPSEEAKNEEKLQLAQRQLDQARALVERLEEQIPSKTQVLETGPRRIVLENS